MRIINIKYMLKINGGMQAKGIWKTGSWGGYMTQDGWEWGVEKAPQSATYTVYLI